VKEKILPFLGGILVGLAVGMLFLSGFAMQVAVGYPLYFMVGIAALAFVGGALLGKRMSPKYEMKLTGRIFNFPQGPVMVQAALKRVGSLIPRKVTQGE